MDKQENIKDRVEKHANQKLSLELSMRALQVADYAFRNDEDGFNHSEGVGSIAIELGLGRDHIAVGYLHDVVEDTYLTLDDLKELGFGFDIIESVDRLTQREGEDYEEYLDRLTGDEVAWQVKLLDIMHNISRNHKIKNKERREHLLKKYQAALAHLLT